MTNSPNYSKISEGVTQGIGAVAGFHYGVKDQLINLRNISNQSIYQMEGLNRQNASIMGQQSLAYLNSGVLINAGTAGKVLEQSAVRASQDVATVGRNYRSQSKAIANQRNALFFSSALSSIEGGSKILSSLMGGGA
jgi:hypothetical protein